MQGFFNNNSNDTKLIDNDLEMVKNALIVLEPIIGRTSYQCWINSGIVDVDIKSRAINIICANSFTARIVKERYSNYIEEIIRPANNSQVKYKKIILIKNCMTNKPFQNTNDYKIWIF